MLVKGWIIPIGGILSQLVVFVNGKQNTYNRILTGLDFRKTSFKIYSFLGIIYYCTLTSTAMGNPEPPINQTCMEAEGSQSTWRKPTQAHGEHANSTQKDPCRGSNQEPSCCEATVMVEI